MEETELLNRVEAKRPHPRSSTRITRQPAREKVRETARDFCMRAPLISTVRRGEETGAWREEEVWVREKNKEMAKERGERRRDRVRRRRVESVDWSRVGSWVGIVA